MRVLDGGDGAQLFQSFVDTELGVDCRFRLASDGRTRCMPDSYGSAYFRDGSCTEPIFVPACNAEQDSPYFFRYVVLEDSCGYAEEAFEVLEPIGELAEVFQVDFEGNCTSFGAPPFAAYALSETAADPGVFVGADEVVEPLDEELGRRVLAADDEAYLALGFHDRARGEACDAPTLAEAVCVPAFAAILAPGIFADETCETSVAIVPPPISCGIDGPPTLIRASHDAGCGMSEAFFYELGDELDGGYQGTSEQCTPAPPQLRYFQVGPPADLGVFPQLDTVAIGSFELTVESMGAAGRQGDVLRPTLVLASTGETCRPVRALDGTRRCLPSLEAYYPGYYADAGCTEAVYPTSGASCSVTLAAQLDNVFEGCRSEQLALELRAVGEIYDGPVFTGTPEECVAVEAPSPLRRLGASISPSLFPVLEEQLLQ